MKTINRIQQLGIRQRSIRSKFMRATELVFVLAIGSTVAITLPAAAQAQTVWTGTTDTDWDTGTNWTGGAAPGAADSALLDTAAGNQPTLGTATPALSSADVSAGTLTVSATGNLLSTTVGISGTGAIINQGAITGDVTVTDGTLIQDGGTLTGSLTLSGTGTLSATTTGTIGAVAIEAGANATLTAAAGTTLTQTGTFNASLPSGSLTFGSATETGRVVMTANGGTYGSSLSFDVAGGTLASAGSQFAGVLANINDTNVHAGATLDINAVDTTVNRLNGSGTVTNSGAADRTLTLTNTSIFGGVIEDGSTNTISLVRSGAGTTTPAGANTYTGTTTVSGGTLALNETGSILNTSGTTIAAGATLDVDGGGNAISDTGTIDNSGTFILTGSDETVGSVFGAGNINLNDNTLTTGDATAAEISGVVSGSGDLVYQGTGSLNLSGANTMTGTIRNTGGGSLDIRSATGGDVENVLGAMSNGGVIAGSVTNHGSFSSTNVINGDVLNAMGGNFTNIGTINGNLTNAEGAVFTANAGGGAYAGDILNNGTFNIAGTGLGFASTFTNNGSVNNTSGIGLTLNVGTGGSFINAGVIDGGTGGISLIGDAYTIGVGSSLTNVTIDVDNLTTDMDYGLSGTTDYNFTNNATATVVADANFSGGDLTNTDTLNVSGGDLTGVGALNNTGEVNIGDGTARVLEASSVTNTGTININDGSTLRGTGNTTNNSGVVNVDSDGTLEEVTGDYNNLTGGTVNFNGTGPKTFDVQAGVITNAGDLNFNDGETTVNSAGGAIDNSGTVTIATGATMDASGDTITNTGTITTTGTLVADTLTNDTGGVVNAEEVLSANVVNQGSGEFNVTDNLNSLLYNFTNTGTATLDVAEGAHALFNQVTNTSTNVSGITIGSGGSLNADFIQNGNGVAASMIVNDGWLGSATSILNRVGSALISNATGSAIAFEGNLNNNGTVVIQGQIAGQEVVNSGTGASFEVVGDLNVGSTNPLEEFTNQNAAVLDVSGGTFFLEALNNTSAGTGTTLDTAGVRVAADGAIDADTISNTGGGTMVNAGTLTTRASAVIGLINGAGSTLISTGTIDVSASGSGTAFANAGTAQIEGVVNGNISNTGRFEATGDLNHTGSIVNNGAGIFAVTGGTVTSSGDFINASPGTGTTADTAGVQVAQGTGLTVYTFRNETGATANIAGTLTTTMPMTLVPVVNVGTMTVESTGVVNGGVQNNGTFVSYGQLNTGLLNEGTASISGEVREIVGNRASGQLNIDGDLLMNSTLRNDGETDVNAGTVNGVALLLNTSAGTGTGAGEAGFEIDEGAAVNAGQVRNEEDATLFVAGTLNSTSAINNAGTLMSTGTLSGGLNNAGSATVRNTLLGDIQNTNGAQLIVDGDLLAGGQLLNDGGGLVDIDMGTVTGVTTLNNAGVGDGTAIAGQAGFEIDLGAIVNAEAVTNSGTMYVAGDLNSDTTIANSGILTSVGGLSGDLTNTLTANLEGTLDGDLTNDAAFMQTTDDLSETGHVANINVAQMQLATGSTFSFEALENDETSLVDLNNGTLDGDVNNAGTLYYSGAITGALVNDGLAEMRNGATDDAIRVGGGLSGVGTYGYDLDLTPGDASADLFAVEGATTGTLNLEFNQLTSGIHLMEDALLVFDVDDGAANDFSYTAIGLDPDGSPVSLFASQNAANGDIFVETGASLTLGALLGGMSQIEGLVNLQAGSLAPHITNCGGAGGWARALGGEVTTKAETENTGQQGEIDIETDYQGVQAGAELGCTTTASGWDLTYSVLAGANSGSSNQDLSRDGTAVDSTALDFDQVYAGFYGSATGGNVTLDLMLSYGQTDYGISNGVAALGLSDEEFSTQTLKLTGSLTNALPLNGRGLSFVQHAGFSASSTTMDDLSFEGGQALEADDFTSTTGFAGVTLNNAFSRGNGATVLNTFAGVTYYGALSSDQSADLVESDGTASGVSTTGVGEFGEVSIGIDFTRKLGGNRTFNTALRADSRMAGDIEGYNVGLQIGYQF